jgi:pimeloyl-ACP methyl ester carboxylesterase
MGGMVALEMSRHLDARGCFLISSVGHSREIPRRWRWLRSVGALVPHRLGEALAGAPVLAARGVLALCGGALDPVRRAVLRQLAAQDRRFLWWAANAVLRWRAPREPWPAPVAQIHGDRDRVLPHARTHPDRLVPGGTHLMVRAHAAEVIRFLEAQMNHLELVGELRPRARASCAQTCDNPIAGALLKG